MKLTTHARLLPASGMSGVISLLPLPPPSLYHGVRKNDFTFMVYLFSVTNIYIYIYTYLLTYLLTYSMVQSPS